MSIKIKNQAKDFLKKLRGKSLTFGRMIESIRKCDEITQSDLAKQLGISRAHLCDIEKERRIVTAERAAKFARILGYSVNQFVALALQDQLRKSGLKLKVQVEAA